MRISGDLVGIPPFWFSVDIEDDEANSAVFEKAFLFLGSLHQYTFSNTSNNMIEVELEAIGFKQI